MGIDDMVNDILGRLKSCQDYKKIYLIYQIICNLI